MDTVFAAIFIFGLFGLSSSGPCQDGWMEHNGSCYIYMRELYTWFEAKVTCEALRGKLVEIETADENTYVINLLRANGGNNGWIGMEDFSVENKFVWVSTQTEPQYTNWHPGEPNDSDGAEDCVVLYVMHTTWNDDKCENSASFVCEQALDRGR